MESKIEHALSLRFPPLALFYAKEPPAEAEEMKPVCSILLLAQAAKGKTVVISQDNNECSGAGEGFGLGLMNPDDYPGGRGCFLRMLSIGNKDWDHGRATIRNLAQGGAPKVMLEEFSEGEGFFKTPELVAQWLEERPDIVPESPFVVVKPLKALAPAEQPKIIAFLVDPDQLSALVVLANFGRPGTDNVRIPFGAGCAQVALYPFYEAEQENPRAVIGLTDISARFYMRHMLGRNILSFAVPWSLFEEMEGNVSESFLTRFAWRSMVDEKHLQTNPGKKA